MSEEGFDLLLAAPKACPAPHLMKVHIALYPRTVALLGTYRIVATLIIWCISSRSLLAIVPSTSVKFRQMAGKISNIVNRQICLSYTRIAQYQAKSPKNQWLCAI